MSKRTLAMMCSVLVLTALAAHANTIPVNLYLTTPTSGYLSASHPTTYDFGSSPSITATGWYKSGGTWSQAPLWNRNESSPEQGIGVCDAAETNCAGTGDQNELSNEKGAELISLALPSGYNWVSFTLGSLDTNSGSSTERGVLLTSNGSDPNSNTLTALCHFASGGTVKMGDPCSIGSTKAPDLTITSGQSSPYLFFKAYDWFDTMNKNKNNDYLVGSAVITTTPEPGGLSLLMAGILGLAGTVRRKSL